MNISMVFNVLITFCKKNTGYPLLFEIKILFMTLFNKHLYKAFKKQFKYSSTRTLCEIAAHANYLHHHQ